MSEEKHTDLPWAVASNGRAIIREVPGMADGCEHYTVGVLSSHSLIGLEEAKANAALIVSSVNSLPDLMKALEDCAGCVDAAEAEGLHEVVEELRGFSEQTDRLIDLIERRLMWPRNYATEALTALKDIQS